MLVVDTSGWISYFAGRGSALIEDALAEGRVLVPPIVVAELLSGRMSAPHRAALEDLFSNLPLCATDLAHWCRVGRMRALLRAKGLSVSTPDAHVAQCAVDLRAELFTEDEIFERISRHQELRLARRD